MADEMPVLSLTSGNEDDINADLKVEGVEDVSVQTVASPNNTQKPTVTTLEEEDASMQVVEVSVESTDATKAVDTLTETVVEAAKVEKEAIATAEKNIADAKKEATEVVKALLASGADCNAADTAGRTPFHCA